MSTHSHAHHHHHSHHPAPHVPARTAWLGFAVALLAGLVFGWGLTLSGMASPLTVQAFLDVAGDWNPSLAFVMGGAVGVTVISFRMVLRRQAPVCGDLFHVPQNKVIDSRLLLGAALFGIGWGLAGYCPGPALTSLLAGNSETWFFVPAMLAGAWLQRRTDRR